MSIESLVLDLVCWVLADKEKSKFKSKIERSILVNNFIKNSPNNPPSVAKKQKTDLSKNMGSGKEVSGLTSSIVLSSASGIQLFDPSYIQKMNTKKGTET